MPYKITILITISCVLFLFSCDEKPTTLAEDKWENNPMTDIHPVPRKGPDIEGTGSETKEVMPDLKKQFNKVEN